MGGEEKKAVLVVGGSSGIGRELVEILTADGHGVTSVSRSGGGESVAFDALDPGARLPLPEVLDALVYLPGSITLKAFHQLSPEEFRKDMELNFFGAVRVLQSAYPALRRSQTPSASVVLFSTVAVAVGLPYHASIASAKAAVEGLGRSLAAEWAPSIRVNVVAPSLTDTPLAEPILSKTGSRDASAKRHPLRVIGDPRQVAELAAFLAVGPSEFMTGQVVRPDGGISSVQSL